MTNANSSTSGNSTLSASSTSSIGSTTNSLNNGNSALATPLVTPAPSHALTNSPTQSPTRNPTQHLTLHPTLASTLAPTRNTTGQQQAEIATIQPQPSLEFIAWDPLSPLGHCQGDCDVDSDCEGTMICFQRNSKKVSVPGCANAKVPGIADFCIYPSDL